jgi:hypothetical protein
MKYAGYDKKKVEHMIADLERTVKFLEMLKKEGRQGV